MPFSKVKVHRGCGMAHVQIHCHSETKSKVHSKKKYAHVSRVHITSAAQFKYIIRVSLSEPYINVLNVSAVCMCVCMYACTYVCMYVFVRRTVNTLNNNIHVVKNLKSMCISRQSHSHILNMNVWHSNHLALASEVVDSTIVSRRDLHEKNID